MKPVLALCLGRVRAEVVCWGPYAGESQAMAIVLARQVGQIGSSLNANTIVSWGVGYWCERLLTLRALETWDVRL